MIGMLHRKSIVQVVDMLEDISELMNDSWLIIVDSILPDPGETPLAVWHCLDMAMRQLQNFGDRTLSELENLAE